jgi:hypothetical protein
MDPRDSNSPWAGVVLAFARAATEGQRIKALFPLFTEGQRIKALCPLFGLTIVLARANSLTESERSGER